jgi:hypothetical protein
MEFRRFALARHWKDVLYECQDTAGIPIDPLAGKMSNAPFKSQRFDERKFKQLVLYFAKRSRERDDRDFGIVKLNKLLYRADFEAFRVLGRSITGETYERQEYGPVARSLAPALDDLRATGLWGTGKEGGTGSILGGTAAGSGVDICFEDGELKLIEDALDDLDTDSGKAPSRWSHEQSAGWHRARESGRAIEYRTALISIDPIPQHELERLAQIAHERGWVETS